MVVVSPWSVESAARSLVLLVDVLAVLGAVVSLLRGCISIDSGRNPATAIAWDCAKRRPLAIRHIRDPTDCDLLLSEGFVLDIAAIMASAEQSSCLWVCDRCN